MRGTVKFYDSKKKWGFIKGTETKKDMFFHQSNIQMKGYRTLYKDDIVDFEIATDNKGREKAVNVTPILTLSMVSSELKKEELHLMRFRDDKGIHGWYIVDKEDKSVVDKAMTLLEVATYVGINTEGLE